MSTCSALARPVGWTWRGAALSLLRMYPLTPWSISILSSGVHHVDSGARPKYSLLLFIFSFHHLSLLCMSSVIHLVSFPFIFVLNSDSVARWLDGVTVKECPARLETITLSLFPSMIFIVLLCRHSLKVIHPLSSLSIHYKSLTRQDLLLFHFLESHHQHANLRLDQHSIYNKQPCISEPSSKPC